MIEHYNAFISYKHAPLDNKVAAEIQTRLERFRIPKAIQKATGLKRIDRIFRDKEELLITSDLNETIENALLHSDFLIVICSHSTKESIWVQREIEFFLKTHSKNQILTVVAEGEPVDVVPQILREQEVTVTLDNGEVETVTMPIEPLSCDYRGDFRKARKEELPRLVAAILGCSYDELKQRQRQYRVRRMTAAFSAVAVLLAALSVYYAWSASQIKENYLQSLRNQSQYLSSESLALLEQGDRFNAMLLALEALPKDDEDERPVLPEAEYALAKAVNAYVSPNTNWYSAEYAFPHGGKINGILTNKDESYLIVLHSDYNLTVWNVDTREKVFEEVMSRYHPKAAISCDDKLLVLNGDILYAYDYRTGQILWQQDAATYKGGSGNPSAFAVSENAPLATVILGDYLVILDTATGQVLQEIPLPTYEHESTWDGLKTYEYSIQYAKFSPDNKQIFLHMDGHSDNIAVCDLEEGEIRVNFVEFFSIDDAFFTEDGNVILIGKYRARNGNYWISPLYYYEDDYTEVACFSPQGELLWAEEIHYTEMDVGFGSEVAAFPYPGQDGQIDAVVAIAGEQMMFLDMVTGEILQENAYTSAIVSLTVYDTHISTILNDGMMGQYLFATGQNMAADFLIDGIDLACDKERCFVSNSDTGNVLLYTYGLHDDHWTQLETEGIVEDSFFSFDKYYGGNTILLTRYNGLESNFIAINSQTRTARIYEALSEEFLESKHLMGLSPDGTKILLQDFGVEGTYVSALDLETMEYIPDYYVLPAGWSELFFQDGVLYFNGLIQDPEGNIQRGVIRQFDDGAYETIPVPTAHPDANISTSFLKITREDDMALVRDYLAADGTKRYYTVNLATAQVYYTDPIVYSETDAIWSSDGQTFFATEENCIIAYDRACRERYRIPCNGMTANSMFCSGEDLLVLYGADRVYRYSVSDGAFLCKVDVDAGNSSVDVARWDDSQPGTLALFHDDTLNLIDTQRWVVRTQVADCLGFCAEDGLIFTAQSYHDEPLVFGYYELYDYLDLIDMAKTQLGDTTLSQEMRTQYGIT